MIKMIHQILYAGLMKSLIIDALSASALKYSGWKPYASDEEIKFSNEVDLGMMKFL
jgi:hypothetical protein